MSLIPSADLGLIWMPPSAELKGSDTAKVSAVPLAAPDSHRAGGLAAHAPHVDEHKTGAPIHGLLLAKLDPSADQAVAEARKLLSTSFLDWFVTPAEARKALTRLEALPAEQRAAAVEALGPALMSKLEEGLSPKDRAQHAEALKELRAARNLQVSPPDEATFLAKAQDDLRGVLGLTWVKSEDALRIIDGLRRFGPARFEALLDAMGPDKVARLGSGLSLTDREVYAPTLRRMQGLFFGNVKRWEEAAGLGAVDRGAELEGILKAVQSGQQKLGPAAQQYAYLLAPGLVTEHQPGYFDENEKRMQARGLTVRRSKLDTDADIATNAKTLAAEIEALAKETGKQVIVLSHSKGGPDTAQALRSPGAAAKTALFISMQAAYGGTPISDPLSDGVLGEGIKGALVKVLGASNGDAFSDLSFGRAKARWKSQPALEVPVLNLATSIGKPSLLEVVGDTWSKWFGIRSDGLVPLDSQVIGAKKSWVSYLEGVDHAGPASRPTPGALAPKYAPGDLTEALILQGLKMIGAA